MSQNNVPLTFRVHPLPENFRGNFNELAQAIANRLTAYTGAEISFFVSGSVAPSYNAGPFWKDNSTWMRWDEDSASYKAQTIEAGSLGYIAQSGAPDQTVFTFWIELDGAGKAIAVKYYSGGAWKDVYEDKFATYYTAAQVDSAISSAVGSTDSGVDNFKARPASNQDVVFGAGGIQTVIVAFGTEDYDPNTAFASNRFTAGANGFYTFKGAIQSEVTAGSPTSFRISGFFAKNGGIDDAFQSTLAADVPGNRYNVGSTDFYLNGGEYVEIKAEIEVDVACTVSIITGFTRFMGFRVR